MREVLAANVHSANIPCMVVTMGGQGAVYARANGESGVVPAKKVDVIDTTGAGDALLCPVQTSTCPAASTRRCSFSLTPTPCRQTALTLMGLEIGGIADYFCRGGVHCCPMSDAITAIADDVWDDAAYAAPGELRYAAVRLLYELLRLPDGPTRPAAPRAAGRMCARPRRWFCRTSRSAARPGAGRPFLV